MRGSSWLLLLALFVGLASPVSAEPAPEPGSAQARYRHAYEAMGRKEWTEARAILLDLWNRARTYDVAASLGQVEYQLANHAAAAEYLTFAVAHVPPKESPVNVERYQRALAEVQKLVASVKISVNPPEASVRVDGRPLTDATANGEVFLAPGVHTLEARFMDRTTTRKVDAVAGEQSTVELDVAGAPGPAGSAPAALAGAASSEPGREKSWVPVYVGGGLVVVGVGAAIGFGVAADDARGEASELRRRIGPRGCADGTAEASDCRAAGAALDRQHRHATWSTIGVGVAVTSAVASAGYLLFWPDAEREREVALGPGFAFDRNGATLSLRGGF